MKILLSILLVIIILSFTSVNKNKHKYLPVYLRLTTKDSNNPAKIIELKDPEFLLYFKAAFKQKGILTISKSESEVITKSEVENMVKEFVKQGGGYSDAMGIMNYVDDHADRLGNSLSIDLNFDNQGYINDTVKWKNYSIPFKINEAKNSSYKTMILDSTEKISLANLTQAVVDSIIASNVLYKE